MEDLRINNSGKGNKKGKFRIIFGYKRIYILKYVREYAKACVNLNTVYQFINN